MWAVGTKKICRDVLYSTAIGRRTDMARAVHSIALMPSKMNIGLLLNALNLSSALAGPHPRLSSRTRFLNASRFGHELPAD
jgi:hypothetical protein